MIGKALIGELSCSVRGHVVTARSYFLILHHVFTFHFQKLVWVKKHSSIFLMCFNAFRMGGRTRKEGKLSGWVDG